MCKHSRLQFIGMVGFIFIAGCQAAKPEVQPTIIPTVRPLADTPTPSQTIPPADAPQVAPSGTPASTPTLVPTISSLPMLAAGATRISPQDGMVLVYIPAGEFLMGSTNSDVGADIDEMPQHTVFLSAFWMDRTVVTNAMYAAFLDRMGNQESGNSTWLDAGDQDVLIYHKNEVWSPVEGAGNLPAVEITWYGAQAYCEWAGRRLPTEAEWEKAARGLDSRVYPWGNEIDCTKAQYANCGGSLLPVGSQPEGASPYGVLGLSGNVWEWVADWYAEDYYFLSARENPAGPTDGIARVLRGGSWDYDWKHLRAANRRNNGPAASMHDYGFRCAVTADP